MSVLLARHRRVDQGMWRHHPGQRPVTNDMDLIETVIGLAIDPGYVLPGAEQQVYRRITKRDADVEAVPSYEADAVHQLITSGHLNIGGTHQFWRGGWDSTGQSVLVPPRTRRQASRWAALARPGGWAPPAQRTDAAGG